MLCRCVCVCVSTHGRFKGHGSYMVLGRIVVIGPSSSQIAANSSHMTAVSR